MSFPKEISDHHKENLTQKCFYLVNLFKLKDTKLWEKYKARLDVLKPEESWEFFHEMLVEYQKLADKKVEKVESGGQKTPKKVAKKVAKKVSKKPAKKPAKKVVTKKASLKKKTPAKKKVAAKKAPTKKKVAKKKAIKKKK